RSCEASQDPQSMRSGKLREIIEKDRLPYPWIALNENRASVMALKGIPEQDPFGLPADNFAAAMVVMPARNGNGAKCGHQGLAPLDALWGKNREADTAMNGLAGRSV